MPPHHHPSPSVSCSFWLLHSFHRHMVSVDDQYHRSATLDRAFSATSSFSNGSLDRKTSLSSAFSNSDTVLGPSSSFATTIDPGFSVESGTSPTVYHSPTTLYHPAVGGSFTEFV